MAIDWSQYRNERIDAIAGQIDATAEHLGLGALTGTLLGLPWEPMTSCTPTHQVIVTVDAERNEGATTVPCARCGRRFFVAFGLSHE